MVQFSGFFTIHVILFSLPERQFIFGYVAVYFSVSRHLQFSTHIELERRPLQRWLCSPRGAFLGSSPTAQGLTLFGSCVLLSCLAAALAELCFAFFGLLL